METPLLDPALSRTSSPARILPTYTAFAGGVCIASGGLSEVAALVKRGMGRAAHTDALVFSDSTGKVMEIDFQGTLKDVLKRLEVFDATQEAGATGNETIGPGRPRLGVVSREVSLLPSHWEWLAAQPGGASSVLRRLVDAARRRHDAAPTLAQMQERVYRFLSVVAGDRPGYEEALRALYRRDENKFLAAMGSWPQDVSRHARRLAAPLFAETAGTPKQP